MAADTLRRGIGLNEQSNKFNVVGRLVVCLVLVQLAREDVVAAEKAFKEWGEFSVVVWIVQTSCEGTPKKLPFA